MEKLICTKCSKAKPLSEFRKDQHNSTGYHSNCNTCHAEYQKLYRNKTRDSYNEKARLYYEKNREHIRNQRSQRKANGIKCTTSFVKTPAKQLIAMQSYYSRSGWKKTIERNWAKRGIIDMTYNRYEEMLKEQNYSCLICDKKHSNEKKLCIDHCHITGKVRGLLCNNCNNGIGKLKDSIQLLEKAIIYLNQNK